MAVAGFLLSTWRQPTGFLRSLCGNCGQETLLQEMPRIRSFNLNPNLHTAAQQLFRRQRAAAVKSLSVWCALFPLSLSAASKCLPRILAIVGSISRLPAGRDLPTTRARGLTEANFSSVPFIPASVSCGLLVHIARCCMLRQCVCVPSALPSCARASPDCGDLMPSLGALVLAGACSCGARSEGVKSAMGCLLQGVSARGNTLLSPVPQR